MVHIDNMRINYTKEGGTITYDHEDWLAGQDTTSGNSGDRKLSNGLAFSNGADPLRTLGYLSPSFFPVDVTNIASVTSLIRNGVVKGEAAYLIAGTSPGAGQSGGIVHKLTNLLAGTISTTAPFPHTIDHAHTGESGYDIVNYTANVSGTPTLLAFYSFSDDTDWDVGIYNYTADTFNDDYMSTVPASPLASPYLTGGNLDPHPLIVGDDDILYMGDRNFVHAYDGATGTDGTFYPAVLTLPKGWIITCFAKTNDQKLLIGAYYSPSEGSNFTYYLGSSKAYKWNYLDLDFDYAYDLKDNYVSDILNWNEQIIAFTSGRNSQTQSGNNKLQALVGERFETLQTWSTGGLPIRGGVMVTENDIYWNTSGLVYFYAKNPFGDNYIFGNILGGSEAGMLKLFSNTFLIHYSSGAGAGLGLRYALSNYAESTIAFGKVATPTFPERKRGRLKKIDLYFKNTLAGGAGGGRSFRLNTDLDKDGGSVTINDFNTVSNLKIEIIDFKADGTPLGDFTTLQPQFIWANNIAGDNKANAPILEKCVYFFEYTDINQGLQT